MSATAPGQEPRFVVPQGGSRLLAKLFVVGDDVVVKIASRDTGGAFAVPEDTTPPKGGPPLHLYREQDEWWYILEGEYLFEVDGKRFKVSAGATVLAKGGTRHTFQNIGSTPGPRAGYRRARRIGCFL